QLADPTLVAQVERIVRETGVRPASLALEITESSIISDPTTAVRVLNGIRALGVRLYMDDFGSGYSSLNCLHQFPLDGLKIDKAFMRNADEHRDYAAVVNAIVSLARHLGLRLIAEGIETNEQIAMLQAMDCDLAQGYVFDRPGDAAAAEEFLVRFLPVNVAA